MSSGQTSALMALRDPDIRRMIRVRDDQPGAFAELVEAFQHRLVGVLSHLLGSPDEAEDLAQEVFLRVYRSRKSYSPKAKFSTWLFTVANNLALNAIRDGKRRRGVQLPSESGPLGPRPAEALAQDRGPSASQALRHRELAERVRLALDVLNERQRAAVVLNKFEDMGYAEIAEVMGLSVKAVKSLLSRARARLREVLEPYVAMDGAPPAPPDDPEDER